MQLLSAPFIRIIDHDPTLETNLVYAVLDAGSKLENHRLPRPEWFLEVMEKSYDIVARNMPEMFTKEFNNSDKVGCYRCSGSNLRWDELRRRLGDFHKLMPRDKYRAKVA